MRWVSGNISAIERPYRPDDGARFQIVLVGCRLPRRYEYRAALGCSLSIWHGKLSPVQAEVRAPLYCHAAPPPIDHSQAAP